MTALLSPSADRPAAGLHIIIVLHDFALGGTERIAVRLANAWVREGTAVTIFCGSDVGPLRPLLDDQVLVVAATPVIPRRRGSVRRLGRALGQWLHDRRFDAAFVPGNYHWPVLPVLAAAGVPVVAQVSASLDKPQRGQVRQMLFDRRMRRLLGRADAVAVLSEPARAQADRILGRQIARVVPLPALDDDVAPATATDPAGTEIVAAGRLVPEKGFADLISAFARLDRPSTRLTIVGDGPARAALERQATRLGLGARVSLPGYAADIRPWLDRARLFVLPSHFEGYPAVVVEALAAGRPVVATDCTPATALLAGGSAGGVAPVASVAGLSAAIARTLDATPPDPATLASSVSHHRIGPVARSYLDLFRAIGR